MLAVVLLGGVLLAPGAGAKVRYPQLATGFGSGGYLALPGQMAAPAGEPARLESISAAPGGAVYVTEAALVGGRCGFDKCLSRGFLARVNSDGSIATTFGGSGHVEVGGAIERLSPAISDRQGRAVVVSQEGSKLSVHRYLADGSVDSSFGNAGVTAFDCGCGATGSRQLELAIDGSERIVVSVNTATSGTPVAETLARLLPSGAMDGGFGSGGILQLGALPPPLGIAFGSNGAIYTWGEGFGVSPVSYLHRVSVRGRIDTTFNASADKTLSNVGARGAVDYRNAVLVVRPHGLLDLYGGDGLLRLQANGKAETKFGDGGVRQLGWSILAATLVGNGRVLGLGETSEGVSLIRLQSNGRGDRSFGTEGARLIEGASTEEGLSLARLNGRRAQVIDLGARPGCRQACGPHPSLVRLRIGPKH